MRNKLCKTLFYSMHVATNCVLALYYTTKRYFALTRRTQEKTTEFLNQVSLFLTSRGVVQESE